MLNIHIFQFNPFSENTYVLYNENKNGVIIDPGNWNEKETEALENYYQLLPITRHFPNER